MVCSVVRRMRAVSWVVYSSPSTRVAYTSSEAAVWPPEAREALAKERPALQRELGRLEGRLELTEQADSTLREQLERERQRADQERERTQRLEAELAERRRGFWRLFGG